MAAGYLFTLTTARRFAEAQTYSEELVSFLPHAVVLAAASVVRLLEAQSLTPDRCTALAAEQLALFERAKVAYVGLAEQDKADGDVRDFMLMAYDAAALTLVRLDRKSESDRISTQALSFWPEAPDLWAARGLSAPSREEARDYFLRATELGATGYMPYYFLGEDAAARGDYHEALKWAREALARSHAGQKAAPRLHGFVAACLDLTGGSRAETDALFRRAIELDPSDTELANAYAAFLANDRPESVVAKVRSQSVTTMPEYSPHRMRHWDADREVSQLLQPPEWGGTSGRRREMATAGWD